MTRFGLIRHGSTAWNKEKRSQGHSDIPLDEEGLAQAVALAERLSHEQWDVIYSSDLQRAKQTADIIAEKLQLPLVQVDSRLREMYGGRKEGTTLEERVQRFGDNWKELDLGEEKPEEGMKRGVACLTEIASQHPGRNILIVSHGAILRHTLRGLVAELDVEMPLRNTSLTELMRSDTQWDCNLYNCTKHIP